VFALSRWKFVFEHDERKENIDQLESLSKARKGQRKLLKIYMELTTRCDGECLHCYFSVDKNKPEFPRDEVMKILEFVKRNGAQSVTYAGGDPIIRNDHIDILKHGRQLGLKQTFCTRGWIKDIEKIKKVVELKPEHIQFSCDPVLSGLTLAEEIERITKIGLICDSPDTHISWVTTFFNGCEEMLKPLLDAVRKSGANEYRVHRILPMGRILNNPELIPDNQQFTAGLNSLSEAFFDEFNNGVLLIEETVQEIKDVLPANSSGKVKFVGCSVGQTAITISHDGCVYLCPLCRHEALKLGDSWKEVFDLWDHFQNNDPFSKELFAGNECGTCSDFELCQGGCRCQAVVKYNDLWAPDPTCSKVY